MTIKGVPGFPGYLISATGEVYGPRYGRMRPHVPNTRLAVITLRNNNKSYQMPLRDAVALTFLGRRPRGCVVRHLDGDVENVAAHNLVYINLREEEKGWKIIEGFRNYRVNKLGDVQSCKRSLNYVDWFTLKPRKDFHGYAMVTLTGDHGQVWQPLVHRLVLCAYVGPCPVGKETRHLNGIPGDNRLCNLRYGTPQENASDKEKHGTVTRGDLQHGRRRLRDFATKYGKEIMSAYAKGKHGRSVDALSRKYRISRLSVARIINGTIKPWN